MISFSSNPFLANDVDRVIGSAVFDIIQAGVADHITPKMLIQHLTRKYVYIYETSASVDEALAYEAAIKHLENS
ncbi:hypothetical protein D3C78_952800 [compost metagenome]